MKIESVGVGDNRRYPDHIDHAIVNRVESRREGVVDRKLDLRTEPFVD